MKCRFCKKYVGEDEFVSFCRSHNEFFIMHFVSPNDLNGIYSFSVCKGIYEIEVSIVDNFTALRSHEYVLSNSPSFSTIEYSHNNVYYGDYGKPLLIINTPFTDLCPDNFDKYFNKLIKLVVFS